MSERVLITPAELVDRWRGVVSEGALAVWRSRGKGPKFLKIGGQVLYDLEDVKAFEESQRKTSTKEASTNEA